MTDNFEEIFKKTRNVRLSSEEKRTMRRSLLDMMGGPAVVPGRVAGRVSLWERWLALPRFVSRPALASFLAVGLLLTGSGISYAAEGSLPGEVLYPVKLGVNETVRGLLSVSPRSKAVWAAERVERRLNEVEALAAASRIDPAEAGGLERVIREQAQEAGERLDRLAEDGNGVTAVVVGAKLEERLQRHQDRMSRMSKHKLPREREALDVLAETVGVEVEDLVQKNVRSEDRLAEAEPELASPVAADRMGGAERRLREAREMLAGREQPAESRKNAEQDLGQAAELLDEGRAAMQKGELSKAFSHFREAQRRARAVREVLENDDDGAVRDVKDDGGDQDDENGRGRDDRDGDDPRR